MALMPVESKSYNLNKNVLTMIVWLWFTVIKTSQSWKVFLHNIWKFNRLVPFILKLLLIFNCPFGNVYILVHFVLGVHIILYVIFKTHFSKQFTKTFQNFSHKSWGDAK